MRIDGLLRLTVVVLGVLVLSSMISAMAASNAVPQTGLDEIRHSTTVNELKPPQCDSLDLTNLIVATGMISGTAENDLILGSAGDDTISGEGGNDCIVSGSGDDILSGDSGTDVCIGGNGSDILFDSCESKH